VALTNAERQRRWREKRNVLAKQAEAMGRTRGRRARRARPADDANAFIGELYEFQIDYSRRLGEWRTLARFSAKDRDHLVDALHSTANELSTLAQQLAGFLDDEA
jgi:hypothetical protein